MANMLLDPPFAADPPIKINVNAKILGLVIGILAIIGLVIGLIALPFVFAITSVAATFCGGIGEASCGHNGIFFLALLGVLVGLAGAVLEAVGGFQMYQGTAHGKVWVIYGLALGLVGGLLSVIGYGAVASFIFDILVFAVIYYLVVISRFPGETPLAATPGGGYGGYGSPPPPPPSA